MNVPQLSALDWTCHVCGRRRPDYLIAVATHTHVFPNGIEEKQNVRYCNDTPSCGATAMIRDHESLLLHRTRLERDALNEMIGWYQKDNARGIRHFLVGFLGGIVIGLLTPVAMGWWPLWS